MQRMYEKLGFSGIEVVAVSIDRGNPRKVKKYIDQYNLTFPVLLDPNSEVAKKNYKTTGVPETFIVDKSGIIVHKAIGPRDWATDETMEAFAQLILGS